MDKNLSKSVKIPITETIAFAAMFGPSLFGQVDTLGKFMFSES